MPGQVDLDHPGDKMGFGTGAEKVSRINIQLVEIHVDEALKYIGVIARKVNSTMYALKN